MNRRRWIGFAAAIILIGIIVALRGTASNDSPDHSSGSDAGNGTSALRSYAQALGHPSSTIEGDFTLPSSHALLFVFTPADGYGYSLSEAQQLQNWIAGGNIVVYAAEQGDPDLDQQFGLHRSGNAVNAAARPAAPIFAGVNRLSGASEALFFDPLPKQVPIFRNAAGDVVALRQSIGSGVLIALTDPNVLCNGYLTLADNGRFAADLLAMTPSGGSVLFDEFHHGAVAGGSPAVAWVLTPWGAALTMAVLVIVLGLALRGRAFGPTVSLEATTDRSSAEYAMAVGSLLHRTGARDVTLQTLLAATRRAVAERVGLSSETPPDQLTETLRQRAPVAGAELASVEAALSRPTTSEQDVLSIARRLHQLAYPASIAAPNKGETA